VIEPLEAGYFESFLTVIEIEIGPIPIVTVIVFVLAGAVQLGRCGFSPRAVDSPSRQYAGTPGPLP
jgi:phosphatidylserine synthase